MFLELGPVQGIKFIASDRLWPQREAIGAEKELFGDMTTFNC